MAHNPYISQWWKLIQHVFTEGEKTKVLSVDDEFDVSYSLKRCLEETGLFQVNGFADATEALTHFRPRIYDLVILDNMMPGMY